MSSIKPLFKINLLLFLIYNISSSYVAIPFKIYRDNEPSTYSSAEEFLKYNTDLNYYGQILMGEEEAPIPIFFNFDEYGFYFVTKGTDIGDTGSSYDPSKSPSCDISESGTVYFNNFGKAKKANETFTFNDKTSNKLKCKAVKFLYAMEDNKKKNSFLMIGLKLIGNIIRDDDLNLIKQLKQKKYIDTYDWSIQYDPKNPEMGGLLLIGTEPHNYNPKKYNKDNYLNSVTISPYTYGIWHIEFDKIYFVNKNNEEVEMNDYMKFSFVHDTGLITGTKEYERKLNQSFFEDFILSKKCSVSNPKGTTRVYSCKNTKAIKKELKNKFPPLKLLLKAYMKTFELTYNDLFKEKGDTIYFLMVFSDYQASYWEVGLPFLKKYYLNFNFDTKLISFYNDDIGTWDDSEDTKRKKIIKTVVIIGLSFIITILGFCVGRKYILLKRKQKLTAKELENEFSKQISASEYQPPINEIGNSKYRLI